MANIYSPPGLLNVNDVLNTIGINKLNKEIRGRGSYAKNQPTDKASEDDYRRTYTLYDFPNLSELEAKLKKRKFLREICKIDITIDRRGCNRQFTINTRRAINFEITSDFIEVSKVTRCLRQLLSEKYLDAYLQHDYDYRKMPPGFWHYDSNWYRLLADGRLCDGGPSPEDVIVGNVYFKKDDVERCLSRLSSDMSINIDENLINHHNPQDFLAKNSRSLINLDTYSTPWLQVLDAVYDEYGKDTLAQVSKLSIEYFMSDYIKKHALDISPSDIPFLAKFIRLAEQKEGKKYHAGLTIKKKVEEAVSKNKPF